MKLGLVSDTHDNIDLARAAVSFFESQGMEAVVHCGDMVAPFTAELFDADFDFYAVRGNNDGEWDLKSTVEEFGTWLGEMGDLEFDGFQIAVYHGTDSKIVRSLRESGEYDYVFRGHTHRKTLKEYNGTIEVNPGGIKFPDGEEEFHVAVLDTETGDIEFHRIKRGDRQ